VGDNLVFRLTRTLTDAEVGDIQQRFEDILKGPLTQAPGPIAPEQNEYPQLSRLLIPFNRSSFSRLRQLIDAVNAGGGPGAPSTAPAAEALAFPDSGDDQE
jgi:hypothetical protein